MAEVVQTGRLSICMATKGVGCREGVGHLRDTLKEEAIDLGERGTEASRCPAVRIRDRSETLVRRACLGEMSPIQGMRSLWLLARVEGSWGVKMSLPWRHWNSIIEQ